MSKRLVFAQPKPFPIPQTQSSLTWDDVKPVVKWIALLGGLTAATYFAYKYLKQSADKSRIEQGKTLSGDELLEFNLQEDIRKIGDIVKNDRGAIEFDAFIKMFTVIRHHSKARLEAGVVELKSRRRAALRESPDQTITEAYRELVSDETALQEQIYQEVTMKVLGTLGLN